MGKGNEGKSLSSSTLVDCDVGLGLKMQLQPPDSYSPSCDGGGGGGPTFFSNQQVGCFGGSIYDAAASRSFHTTAFRAGEGMPASGKALFTASQWQELERQKIIHKYIMASVAVPPELLLSTSRLPSFSQYNTPGLDLRFSSNGSDPEPWRCKRTDGKKWRCSRDVAPDQKYCERHAHKSRPRSRKHVEAVTTSSHNTTTYSNSPQPLMPPASQLPTMASPNTSYDQTRYIEWFMRGETIPVSTSVKQQQWQQQTMPNIPSPRLDLERDISDYYNKNNNNVSEYYHPQFEDKQQGFILGPNPFLADPILDPKLSERTHETRHFIDAWEKEGCLLSASPLRKKISPPTSSSSSSLSLSMSGGLERESDHGDLRPSQWMMNTWMNMNSAPGGPLGEALCLGNANTTRGSSSLASSPHNSSCSKSSCEDGSHAFNFIG